MRPPLRPPPLTADSIFGAFPEGIFGVRGALAMARLAGHGWGTDPEGVTQIDLGFEGVRVETAQERGLPTALVVNELIFHSLTEAEAQLTFPLTLRIERYTHPFIVDSVPTDFDAYALAGQTIAVAVLDDARVTVRCSEAMLADVELVRLGRSEVKQIADQGEP